MSKGYGLVTKNFGLGNLTAIAINAYLHKKAQHYSHAYPQMAIFSHEHIGLRINLFGRYEADELELIEAFLAKTVPNCNKMVALDIGANIGNHSVFFAKLFQQVFAFEPNPVTFKLLAFNAEHAAQDNNITCFNLGLSDSDTEGTLVFNTRNIGGGTLKSTEDDTPDTKRVEVTLAPLDQIDEFQDKQIGLIKIDVEGHEIHVLKGAKHIINTHKPIILFEQNADEITNGSSETIEFLRAHKYKFAVMIDAHSYGSSVFGKAVSYLHKLMFGHRLRLVDQDSFRTQTYHIIVAIPQD